MNTIIKLVSMTLLIFCLMSLQFVNAYKVTGCDYEEILGITPCAEFIQDNMNEIVALYTFLTEEQRQEIIRKWVTLNIHCAKDGRNACSHGSLGVAHGGIGNRVNLCYQNMVLNNDSLCECVGTIMHETGHTHGFKALNGHNDPTEYIRASDPMYRMGDVAEEYCESVTNATEDTALQGTTGSGLGSFCTNRGQCSSNKCEKNTCVCNDKFDCPSGQECFTPVFKANYCSSSSVGLGGFCTGNGSCSLGKCEDNTCVCKKNSDCPNGKCKKPIFGKNYCKS